MRRLVPILCSLLLLAFGVLLDGCNQQSVTATLRSLQSSTNITFVCQGHTTDGIDQGLSLDQCPDLGLTRTRTLLGVVTQPTTNELAIVDMDYQKVVDVNPGIPGFSFLRLPSRPGTITSTPGGVASFVGLTSPGKFGISAIPSTCLGAPRPGQHERDLTTFPACTLPFAPGDIAVVVEPPHDGVIAESCAASKVAESSDPPAADLGRDCPANLTKEAGPAGRRKLVVTLPDAGQLAVIDAQALLDRTPGSFDPCTVERLLQLDASPDTTGQAQAVPSDLKPAASCTLKRPPPMPAPANASSRPSRIAATDGKLYVSDLAVPAVHVLDSSSVCGLTELPPLLPMSYLTPTRVVTTSNIAVSPLTPAGHQYVYAVDPNDQPSSVMAFDVSPGVTDRTPIVREGSARQPAEIPDRITFAAPVADLDFALRDLPYEDPITGVAQVGVRCDPNPDASLDPPTPGVQYRTTLDYTQGARPGLLRGLFGLVMLTNGQVEVIDIDDFDAPCRRNIKTNASSTADFRGCKDDTIPYPYLTTGTTNGLIDGTQTVSNEVSCNMVEPHRPRAGNFGLSLSLAAVGLGAPTLRSLPQFSAPASVTNLAPHDQPKLLAVPFADPSGSQPAAVYVGTTLYQQGDSSAPLRVDPNDLDDQDSALTLPLIEPRSYPSSEHDDLVFEGRVMGDKPSGFLSAADGAQALADETAFFCDNGVYDIDAMTEYAQTELGIKDATAAANFGKAHADYVQVTGDFPSLIDSYWNSAPVTHGYCVNKFGEAEGRGLPDLQTTRDLSIVEAYQDRLVVTQRLPDDYDSDYCDGTKPPDASHYCPPTAEDFANCFPAGMQYTVRGSRQWVLASSNPAVTRNIIADPTPVVDPEHPDAAPKPLYRCVPDCDPRRQHFRGRVFEIGRSAKCASGDCSVSAVGAATELDGPCSYDPTTKGRKETHGVGLDEPASACIFENLTARFAVYRGLQPSARDMSFSWDTTGGFYPLAAPLSAISTAVLPQTVRYIPEYQSFAVVDASALGVSLIGLDTLRVLAPWPVY